LGEERRHRTGHRGHFFQRRHLPDRLFSEENAKQAESDETKKSTDEKDSTVLVEEGSKDKKDANSNANELNG
jgi:hypothetical protein